MIRLEFSFHVRAISNMGNVIIRYSVIIEIFPFWRCNYTKVWDPLAAVISVMRIFEENWNLSLVLCASRMTKSNLTLQPRQPPPSVAWCIPFILLEGTFKSVHLQAKLLYYKYDSRVFRAWRCDVSGLDGKPPSGKRIKVTVLWRLGGCVA